MRLKTFPSCGDNYTALVSYLMNNFSSFYFVERYTIEFHVNADNIDYWLQWLKSIGILSYSNINFCLYSLGANKAFCMKYKSCMLLKIDNIHREIYNSKKSIGNTTSLNRSEQIISFHNHNLVDLN